MFGKGKKDKDKTMTDPMGITVLHDGGQNPQVDIIAVHGLNGGSESTWTYNGDGRSTMWLRDFLPNIYPRCRIMTYGFAADGFSGSEATIRTLSQFFLESITNARDNENEATMRPIIFLAHSLGGLIVKDALIRAQGSAYYGGIHKATYGILLFGTPHRGSSTANFAVTLGRIASVVSNTTPSRLIEALKVNSETLHALNDSFTKQKFHIVSFFEALPTPPLNILIVDENSAKIGLHEEFEKTLQMNLNHQNMCKFPCAESVCFRVASGNIGRFVQAATKKYEAGMGATKGEAAGGDTGGGTGLVSYTRNYRCWYPLSYEPLAISPGIPAEVPPRVIKAAQKANNLQALKDEKTNLEHQCQQLKKRLGEVGKKRQLTESARANFKTQSGGKTKAHIENVMNKYGKDLRRLEGERTELESKEKTATKRIQSIETNLHSNRKG